MEAYIYFLFVLVGSFAALQLVDAQDQTGFISLDCGLVPKDEKYTETLTNLTFRSDADFINTGESKRIQSMYEPLLMQQFRLLRSFPQGERNCYNLTLTKDQKYLIRATFVYANYDNLNQLPKFDLYIGPNKWTSVEIQGVTTELSPELIHVTSSNRLQVCLVKTGSTVPFISSLELRPLKNNTYTNRSKSLSTFKRWSFTQNQRILRFDEDVYDRKWTPKFQKEWTRIRAPNTIDTNKIDDLPQLAMRTAATPTNASEPLRISWNIEDGTPTTYVHAHFAEIELLKANESRVFDIFVRGGLLLYPSFSPSNFSATTLWWELRFLDGKYDFAFRKTENSTHPPLVNAIEIYTVVKLPDFETYENDVNAIMGIKGMYGFSRISWQGDPCSPQEYLWDGLNCSYKNLKSPRITSLNLSSSGLTGRIAPFIQDLTWLEVLDLSNNSLTGEIPNFLAKMRSLKIINLRDNNLNGSIPAALISKFKDSSLNIEGNQIDCPSDACDNNKPKKKKFYIVAIVVSVSLLAVVSTVLGIFFIFRRGKRRRTAGDVNRKSSIESEPLIVLKDRKFTYSDVLRMTKCFQRVLGQGAFGAVYHGYVNDKKEVAVKMLSHATAQGYKQFKAEVKLLLRVHHRNLVNLVGYCNDSDYLALIYEYMINGNLREHLTGEGGNEVLSWAARLQIAVDAAQGLEYLHNGCKPPMVHRDVKTTNILLDEHFRAKIADFGLSRSFSTESQSHISTDVAGTPGYIDPEYYRTNMLSEKSDVYSFGVVLLEIITNQSVIDNTRERPHITEWVYLMLTGGDIMKIMDWKLHGAFDLNIAWKVVELAISCMNRCPSRRPTMPQVVMELNECLATETTRMQGRNLRDWLDATMSVVDEFAPGAK